MSWSKLAPIAKTTGRPMASASIQVNKDQIPKVALILSASLKDEFGDPKRCDISAGEGEHEGALLIEFAADGAFEIKNFVHGGARIFLPIPPGCPDKPATNAGCTIGEKVLPGLGKNPRNQGNLVINLPVGEWAREIAQRHRPGLAAAAVPAAPPPPAGVAKGGDAKRFDMVEYLSGKGVKISRLAENRYSVGGDTLVFGQVLKMVNDRRKAADLDPISLTHAW